MMKKITVCLVAIALIAIVAMYTINKKDNNKKQIKNKDPKLSITAINGDNLEEGDISSKGNLKTKIEFCEKDFKAIMTDTSFEQLPYVKIGDKIAIDWENMDISKMILTEHLLNKNGVVRFGEEAGKLVKLNKESDNSVYFTVDVNLSATLSSDLHNYQPGNTVRGFHLKIKGKEQHDYYFVIRSDALESFQKSFIIN